MAEKKSKSLENAEAVLQERRLPPLLRRSWYGLNQAFRRRIKNHPVTPDQYTVLRLLSEAGEPGLSQRELCGLMGSDPNTVGALVLRMLESNLLARELNPADKRAHRVTIAPKGRRVYKTLRAIALKLQHEILNAVPAHRRNQFLKDLECVANVCSRMAEKA